jgi:hypothetical protein
MAKKQLWWGVLALALTFGITVVGCDNGSKDSGSSDPIKVDLKLPAIQDVAPFTGEFVSTEEEAKDLIGDAVDALGEIADLFGGDDYDKSIRFAPRSMAREVWSDSIDEIVDHETIAPGVTATGFIKGKYKMSIKNEETMSAGDYYEYEHRIKLGIDLAEAKDRYNSFTFNGKYIFDEEAYEKDSIISLNPNKGKLTIKWNATNGYALSVSKGGKGLKFVMQEKVKINKTIDVTDDNDGWDDLYNDVFSKDGSYVFTIEVYDNANNKTYSQEFKDPDSVYDYLGTTIGGFF